MKAAGAKGEEPAAAAAQDLRLERCATSSTARCWCTPLLPPDEILMLIRVADEFGFKVRTFQHVLEGYKVASEIARHGAGGSTFSDWWAYKMEALRRHPLQRRRSWPRTA